jgi:hypothetical protein
MAGPQPKGPPKPAAFRLGQWVQFMLVDRPIQAVVVEDRGLLGYGGRRIHGIEFDLDPWNHRYGELPEDDLVAVDSTPPEPQRNAGKAKTKTKTKKRLQQAGPQVGDHAQFKWGGHAVDGVIVEDRGPLGGGGRHLYRILFRIDSGEELPTELAASDFTLVKAASNGPAESGTAR